MNEELISIIIPCYNVERTIKQTIVSVLRQTYKNIEIICIDDCSEDNTYETLIELSRLDERIKVFKNEKNLNVGPTRNRGINLSQGEFIAFIDGDDLYEPDFISVLYETLIESDADISQCQIRYIFNEKNYFIGSPVGIVDGEQVKIRIDIEDGLPYISPHPWNKLYKKNLFKNVFFEGFYFEDTHIVPRILEPCKKFVVTNKTHYHYNKRDSGITGIKKRDLNTIKFFLQSIHKSCEPYFNDDFIEAVDLWGAKYPRCIYANLSNFLNGLIKINYSKKEKEEIKKLFNDFWTGFHPKVPRNLKPRFENIKNDFFYLMGFDRRSIFYKFHSKLKTNLMLLIERYMNVLDFLFIKDKNKWLFSAWARCSSGTLDNPRAIYEKVKDDTKIKKIVILHTNDHIPPYDAETNTTYCRLKSVSALFHMITSHFIITGYSLHSLFGYRRLIVTKSRKIIQLWHGIPIKKVGLQVDNKLENHWKLEIKRYFMTIANSEVDKVIMKKSFFPDDCDRVKLTGLPRHDLLVMDEMKLPQDYLSDLKNIKKRIGRRKLILFAPTWRYDGEKPCMFSEKQFYELNTLLSQYNFILGVRVHANMLNSKDFSAFVSDHIVHFNDIADVNIILRESSALITDYSSLYLDFMMLERPVLLYTPDIDRYKNHRGFNYISREFIPHNYIINDFDILIHKLGVIMSGKYVNDESYYDVLRRFSSFSLDGRSSERVLELLK